MGAEGQGWLVCLTVDRTSAVLKTFGSSGARMLNKSARNERRKLTAGFFNAVASGTVLAALVTPFVGLNLGILQLKTDMLNMVGLTGFGVTVALVVHLVARDVLKGLED